MRQSCNDVPVAPSSEAKAPRASSQVTRSTGRGSQVPGLSGKRTPPVGATDGAAAMLQKSTVVETVEAYDLGANGAPDTDSLNIPGSRYRISREVFITEDSWKFATHICTTW